ncbi:NAD-dependent protein deacylase [Lachnospira sp.]|jgi:NAD-dependent deacetylase|uniref:NAD-dependent protein deacylase n=1 Tax=Lachnospira sp. TaxID=2049031 RepID=UPI00257AA94A|nr:NAD-dependent protein deacylase [Lachnospira sp.]
MSNIDEFLNLVKDSDNIVFFGGAGVSTESGIPDFRGADGLYMSKYNGLSPEEIISHSFYLRHPDVFYEFYREKMLFPEAKPSTTHLALAKLEKMGKLKGVITQNIDGLHQMAGSKNVVELHGSVHRNYCTKCHKFYDMEYIFKSKDIPKCSCGGVIKPDVVLYEEGLNEDDIYKAVDLIRNADVLIIGGTSLGVYPAAGFVNEYRGNKMVLINKSKTPYDSKADLLINDALGEVFKHLL